MTYLEHEKQKRLNPDEPTAAESFNELGAAFRDALEPVAKYALCFVNSVVRRDRLRRHRGEPPAEP